MESNIFDQHITILEAALKKVREAKNMAEWLEYNLQVKRKSNVNNEYMNRLIKRKRENVEHLVNEYDIIISQLVTDKINNPILERHEN